MQHRTDYVITTSALFGAIAAPPSKSHSLRAILLASMAKGQSVITRYLHSPDITAMIDACRQLGAGITVSAEALCITGVAGMPRLPNNVIDAGNSGQVLRFVTAIAGLIDGYSVVTGDHSIRFNRPMAPLIKGLTDLGAMCISTKGDGYAPLIIRGPMHAGTACIDGAISQPVSGLLMASVFLQGETEIIVENADERAWVALTLSWFDRLGIAYTNDNFQRYRVTGGKTLQSFHCVVPGDYSAIAFPIVAALITRSELTITNIDSDEESQGDKKVIDVLCRMGANITLQSNCVHVHRSDVLLGCDIEVNEFSDALPILAVIACYAKGKTRLLNAAVARKKESDRVHAITVSLKAMGARIVEKTDAVEIEGSVLHAADVHSYQDHRIAMSLIVAALGIEGKTIVRDADCIAKSFPSFLTAMQAIGANIQEIRANDGK